jgi:hypothetical protein
MDEVLDALDRIEASSAAFILSFFRSPYRFADRPPYGLQDFLVRDFFEPACRVPGLADRFLHFIFVATGRRAFHRRLGDHFLWVAAPPDR